MKAIFLFLFCAAPCFSQTAGVDFEDVGEKTPPCKTYQLLPISEVAKQPINSCVKTVGTVTFIRPYGKEFRFELMDSRDRAIMVTASEEPYTDEVLEVFGKVDGKGIDSDKHLVIKGALPRRQGEIAVRRAYPR